MDFLGPLASNGLLGLLLAYTLWDNRELRKENKDLQEQRVLDAKATIQGVATPLDKISEALNEQKPMLQSLFSVLSGRKND